MQTPGVSENAYVLVEYEFEYTAKDGKIISIKPNERYLLLKKTNDHWWHVRQDERSKPFYIPAKYVKELPSGIQPSNGLSSYSEPNELHPTEFVHDTSVIDSRQYMYKFISDKNDTTCNPYIQKSDLHQPHLSQHESGSDLSIPDIFVSDIIHKSSRENLLPQIGEERFSSTNTLTPLRTFGSFHRLPIRKTMYGPEFTAPSAIRSSQSLDDLARLTPERKAGDRRSEVVAGSRIHSRSLTRSDSENIYETIQNLPGQRNMVNVQAQDNFKVQNLSNKAIPAGFSEVLQGNEVSNTPDSRHVSDGYNSQQQVSQETNSSPVYMNVAELRQEAAKAGSSSRLQSTSSTIDEWETHTDQDSGKLFYYNSLTGETTWETPFYQSDDPVNSPNSVNSEASPIESEWERYFDEPTGRFFFYNSSTGETSWQPPEQEELSPHEMKPMYSPFPTMEQRPPTPETDYPENSPEYDTFPAEDYSPQETHHNFFFPFIQPERSPIAYDDIDSPPGWSCEINKDGKTVYTHINTHEMWLMSKDDQGQTFFHTPDGSESQWTLPQRPLPHPPPRSSNEFDTKGIRFSSWNTNSAAFIFTKSDESKGPDKAGVLNKTKVAENGKRLRKKNWSSSWTVLEGSILTFYKDGKNQSTNSMKQSSSFSTPEYTVELRGASVCWAPREKSSKKNVLELKTRGGSEYLVQHDTDSIATGWYNSILDSIQMMSVDTTTEHNDHPQEPSPSERIEGTNKEEKEKKAPGVGQKSNDVTMDSTDSRKVRNKLKRLLQRRPTLQSLRDKGYIKDQVFGCHLHVLCEREKTSVPTFVKECIKTVENRGLDIDGLYRVSGNLATIQKLRFKVDHDENLNLDDGRWEDVHVITGALKLFFRELPEPLFPFSHFDRFISAIKISDQKAQINYLKELVQSLPLPNRDTMKALFQHLCRVIEKHDENRMSVKSVAIVFGPTLLKKETEAGNIAMHMVFQNQVVEQILSNCNYIFAES
ncbi:rho GTPase-activating protein 27 isoform X3 [Pleurodeles waltl]|uniref:rho GTPase-activating protein 27 isoform X3 n=2 Tax=Pleurodeles waltl TaxID=8319 RepID=UPI0037097FF5